jgi:signal transduction histidine kinase
MLATTYPIGDGDVSVVAGARGSLGKRYRQLLILLAVAAVLPMMIYGSIETWLRTDAERRALDAANLEEAQRLALVIDNELMAEIHALDVLSLSRDLDSDDLQDFYALARRAHFDNALWRAVILVDPHDGRILLNTLFPLGSPYVPINDRRSFQRVLETHSAVIGVPTGPALVRGTTRMHPAFVPLRVPVMRGNEVYYVLSASMAPDRLRALLWNAMPPGLGGESYLVDPEGHIVSRNRSPSRFARWAPEAVRAALPQHEGVYRGAADGQREVFAFATAPFSHWSVHLGIPTAEYDARMRRPLWLSIAGMVLAGVLALSFIAMIWREIKHQHRAESALQNARRIEAIGQLTAGVAHDFNTLLSTVIGNLWLIKTRIAKSEAPSVAGPIEDAVKAAEHGAQLTQHLLSFASKQMLRPEPVDLNATLQGLEGLIHQSVSENIRVRFELREGGCWTIADPNELSLSILNLVTNARDAMPDGGILTLATEYTDLRPGEHVDHLRPGRYALIVVTDTGVGMSEAVIARAFEPFFTTKEVGKGTGLGLSQVYGTARQSHGTVQLISREGQGCRAEIWLPQCDAPQ